VPAARDLDAPRPVDAGAARHGRERPQAWNGIAAETERIAIVRSRTNAMTTVSFVIVRPNWRCYRARGGTRPSANRRIFARSISERCVGDIVTLERLAG